MARKRSMFHAGKSGRRSDIGAPLVAVWRRLAAILGGGYRPEQHYMRGPGPKWLESHSAKPATGPP